MDKRIIDDMPEIWAKVKPYVEYLESMGFKTTHQMAYFHPGNEENYTFFNGWQYQLPNRRNDLEVVVDLVSYTHELKLEIYKFSIVKPPKHYWCGDNKPKPPFILTNLRDDVNECYESTIVDNLTDFKKEIGKFFNTIKKYNEKIKKYELEKDFT